MGIVGIDLGFVQCKAVWGSAEKEKTRFGSLVKRRSEAAVDTGKEDSEGFLIESDTGAWNVGSKGTYDFTSDRLTKDSDVPKLLTVLGLFNQSTGAAFIDRVVSGLPVAEFNSYKESFRKALVNAGLYGFNFYFNGNKKWLRINEATIIPQSAGAYYDYILSEDGQVKDTELAFENVLVLDVGGRTSDGCIMEESKYSQDSFTIMSGVWKVQMELRKLMFKKFRYNASPIEVDRALRSGYIKLAGANEDIKDLKTLAIETIYPSLQDELSLHIEDYRRFSAILLAGGGAYLYKDYLVESTGLPVIVLDNAEYANASGYRKYGILTEAT